MISFRKLSPAKFSLAAVAVLASTPVFANELENSTVNLAVGHWITRQSFLIGGGELSPNTFAEAQCLTQADSAQTVDEYLNEFIRRLERDLTCEFSEFRGVAGDVALDVMCTDPEGAKTKLCLLYTSPSPRDRG